VLNYADVDPALHWVPECVQSQEDLCSPMRIDGFVILVSARPARLKQNAGVARSSCG
jgi:hypothetical protein